MKNRLFLSLSVLFALLQGPFLPSVFMEGALLVIMIFTDRERIPADKLLSLFVGGLIFDLLQGRTLGVTSLIFGVSALVLKWRSSWILGLVALVLDLARSRIVFGEFLWIPAITGAILTILFFRIVWQPSGMSVKLR